MCKEFLDLIRELGILCVKCLDTTLMWKIRDDLENLKDDEYFIIIRCDKCTKNDSIVAYSSKSNLYYNNIPIFHAEDEHYSVRFPALRKLHQNRLIQTELFDLYL